MDVIKFLNSARQTNKLISSFIMLLFTSAVVIFFFISYYAYLEYTGSKFIYLSFCFVSFSLIALSLIGRFSYFYFFLALFLFLGFWSKTSLYFAFNHPLLEPTGFFDYSAGAWNKALIVSSLGLAGVCFSRLLMILLNKIFDKNNTSVPISVSIPVWYDKYAKIIWIVTILAIIITVVCNSYFKLYQVGVVPTYHMPFKLGALMPACINIGFTLWLATLIWWDVQKGKRLLPRLFIAIFSAFLFSTSIMSRGLYLYQAGHYIVSIYRAVKDISLKQWSLYFIMFILGLFITVKLTMYQRDTDYKQFIANKIVAKQLLTACAKKQYKNKAFIASKLESNTKAQVNHFIKEGHYSSSGTGNIFLKLAVERWIGIEGVLSTSSWADANFNTFKLGWTKRLARDTGNPYNKISRTYYYRPSYKLVGNTFFYSSLPGFIAMLDYSGRISIVIFGAFILCFFFMSLEYWMDRLLRNPFYLSYSGIYLAIILTMLGSGHSILMLTVEIIILTLFIYTFSRNKI